MRSGLAAFLFLFVALSWSSAFATTRPELVPQQTGIDQNLDQQLDLKLPFTSTEGETRPLSEFLIPGRPTIIVPVYYGCPRLCGFTLDGVTELLNNLDFKLGTDYEVLAVSFDHEEGPELAKTRRDDFYAKLKLPDRTRTGWRFLTGKQESVRSLMSQLGFKFEKDGEEFAHAAALMILTPSGRIARYFFGIQFAPSDVRYSLIEASQGRIGGVIDHVFLYCFRFDPTKGKYSLVVWNVTRAICALFAVVLAAFLLKLKLRYR